MLDFNTSANFKIIHVKIEVFIIYMEKILELDDDTIEALLRAPTKRDLIKKGKLSHHRQQKIVGGSPVEYGKEAPWTVR